MMNLPVKRLVKSKIQLPMYRQGSVNFMFIHRFDTHQSCYFIHQHRFAPHTCRQQTIGDLDGIQLMFCHRMPQAIKIDNDLGSGCKNIGFYRRMA